MEKARQLSGLSIFTFPIDDIFQIILNTAFRQRDIRTIRTPANHMRGYRSGEKYKEYAKNQPDAEDSMFQKEKQQRPDKSEQHAQCRTFGSGMRSRIDIRKPDQPYCAKKADD